MKGTLFSSDFAVDGSDNLRLLEINTDTGFTSASFQHFDFYSQILFMESPSPYVIKTHCTVQTVA